MPSYKATGIVLHRLNLGETDKIVTLLTRENGKLGAVVKGARRVNSKLSGATELFTYSNLLLATGKNLDIVSQGEIRESFPALRDDLPLLARATYLCELVDRLSEERDPNAEVFDTLLSALYLLQRAADRPDIIVHAFELRLLAERGYAPELTRCVRCGESAERQKIGFSPSLGGVLCRQDRFSVDDSIEIGQPTLAYLLELLTAEPEHLLTREVPPPATARETARCLRWYIRYRAERDLKSAEFLDMLRAAT